MRTLLTLLLLPNTLWCFAQNSTGTEHWVAFMENLNLQFNGPPSFYLAISSEPGASGQVQIPATGFAIPFSIPAGSDTLLALPQNVYYASGDEVFYNFGIRVVADGPVSVYAYHDRTYFSDASLILPRTSLGVDHLVLAHVDYFGASPSEFVVLATESATVVEITPSVVTVGFRPPGVPFTVTLNQGQTFQLQAFEDLSGTRVRSLDPTKPIALFAGARQARVNCDAGGADDHLYNQVYPLQSWGRDYVVVPFRDRGGDQVRVLAGSDGTVVTIGGLTLTLDSGEVAETDILQPTRILSNAPIAVGQFNDSQQCNNADGDPSYTFLPQLSYTDERYLWHSHNAMGTPQHFVNVVVQAGDGVDPVLLDGLDISDQFEPVPDVSGWWFAQVSIAEGSHELVSPKPFQALAYGFGSYNSYAYALGFENDTKTGIEDPDAVGPSHAYVVLRGGSWSPNWTDPSNGTLRILDLRGRLVEQLTYRPGGAVPVALNEGLYVFECWNNQGLIERGRLLVR